MNPSFTKPAPCSADGATRAERTAALPTVSVVIPSFNSFDVLDRAIDSTLAQTHAVLEVVVVDDGSTDGTFERLDRREGYVVCMRQDNQGPAAARNAGARAARGEWIAFLDADDGWLPHKIARQLQAAHDEGAAAVFCGMRDRQHTRAADICYEGPVTRDVLLPGLIGGNLLHGGDTTMLIRRDVFLAVGGFDPSYKVAEDRDLFIRIVDAYPIAYVRELLALRFHGPVRYGDDALRNLQYGEQIVRRHAHRLTGMPRAARTLRRARARVYERAGLLLLEYGETGAALREFARAAALWPLLANPWKAAFNVLSGRRRYAPPPKWKPLRTAPTEDRECVSPST